MSKPAHNHDCARCVFVGIDRAHDGEPATNQVDMYVHVGPTQTSLIRRYSSEPESNGAWSTARPLPPRYQSVFDAALKRGLICSQGGRT